MPHHGISSGGVVACLRHCAALEVLRIHAVFLSRTCLNLLRTLPLKLLDIRGCSYNSSDNDVVHSLLFPVLLIGPYDTTNPREEVGRMYDFGSDCLTYEHNCNFSSSS